MRYGLTVLHKHTVQFDCYMQVYSIVIQYVYSRYLYDCMYGTHDTHACREVDHLIFHGELSLNQIYFQLTGLDEFIPLLADLRWIFPPILVCSNCSDSPLSDSSSWRLCSFVLFVPRRILTQWSYIISGEFTPLLCPGEFASWAALADFSC